MKDKALVLFTAMAVVLAAPQVLADKGGQGNSKKCKKLPSYTEVTEALVAAVGEDNGGLGLNMWATVVDRDGLVCLVAMSGENRGQQWPGSRVISAQKANTANAFSLGDLALSTANLYSAVQPGGSLYGLQHSNPVDTAVAYGNPSSAGGNANKYGTASDPLRGRFIGGVNVFGGGLALYDEDGALLGGLGVSGDTSCADHNIAWRVRETLGLDNVPAGINDDGEGGTDDGIIYDIDPDTGKSAGGFGHPTCGGTEDTVAGDIGSGTPPPAEEPPPE